MNSENNSINIGAFEQYGVNASEMAHSYNMQNLTSKRPRKLHNYADSRSSNFGNSAQSRRG